MLHVNEMIGGGNDMVYPAREDRQRIAALFSSYQEAHDAVQHLYNKGYVDFTVSYVQAAGDQTIDGEGGFYPDHSSDVQIPVEHNMTDLSEQEVPQISALSTSGSQRTAPSLHERLDMLGIPQEYTNSYLTSLTQGQVLAVIRPRENVSGMMSELTNRALSVRSFEK
jgi:hypothetical protein